MKKILFALLLIFSGLVINAQTISTSPVNDNQANMERIRQNQIKNNAELRSITADNKKVVVNTMQPPVVTASSVNGTWVNKPVQSGKTVVSENIQPVPFVMPEVKDLGTGALTITVADNKTITPATKVVTNTATPTPVTSFQPQVKTQPGQGGDASIKPSTDDAVLSAKPIVAKVPVTPMQGAKTTKE